MTRFAPLALSLGLFGCGQQPADTPAPGPATQTPANVVVAAGPTEPSSATQPVTALVSQAQPKPPEPPAFEYPADLGGKAVQKAVAPDRPALAAEGFATGPKPRKLPVRLLDPDPVAKVRHSLPPLLPKKAASVKPIAPPERVPVALGAGADDVPARPTFPIAAGVTERARDVKLPPAMPTLGRPLSERVSLDDPTAEVGNAAITSPPVKVSVAPAAFLKVSVPDPFEFGSQIKPKVLPTADPGLAPVVVDPQRVK
jgi:hypothetical protein